MSWRDPDVYYQPEHFGLTIIDSLDDPEACYSFDLLVVWQHEDGRLFWGQDSGCSCPSPFEDVTSLDDLTPLVWDEFVDAVKGHCSRTDYKWGDKPEGEGWTAHRFDSPVANGHTVRWERVMPDPGDFAADKTQMLAKVHALLPK